MGIPFISNVALIVVLLAGYSGSEYKVEHPAMSWKAQAGASPLCQANAKPPKTKGSFLLEGQTTHAR